MTSLTLDDIRPALRGLGSPKSNFATVENLASYYAGDKQPLVVEGTSVTQDDLTVFLAASGGDDDDGGRKPPKTAEPMHFPQPYDSDPDSLLYDLKGLYNTYDIQLKGITHFAAKDIRPYEERRKEHLRKKMGDILRCVWALQGDYPKSTT